MARPTYDPRTWWAPRATLGRSVAHRVVVALGLEGITQCGQAVPLRRLRSLVDGDERCADCFLLAPEEAP